MSKADDFTTRKLAWVEQVLRDTSLPLLARVVGTTIATLYLNRQTETAWPAMSTLTAVIGRGWTQVRAALEALEQAGHLKVTWSKGGKGQTHEYQLIHKPIPHGNPRGIVMDDKKPNPTEIRAKPHGNPNQTPRKSVEEPFDEPNEEPTEGAGLQPAPDSQERLESVTRGTTDPVAEQDAQSAPAPRRTFADHEHIELWSGVCQFVRWTKDGRACLKSVDTGEYLTRALNADGRLDGERPPCDDADIPF